MAWKVDTLVERWKLELTTLKSGKQIVRGDYGQLIQLPDGTWCIAIPLDSHSNAKSVNKAICAAQLHRPARTRMREAVRKLKAERQ